MILSIFADLSQADEKTNVLLDFAEEGLDLNAGSLLYQSI